MSTRVEVNIHDPVFERSKTFDPKEDYVYYAKPFASIRFNDGSTMFFTDPDEMRKLAKVLEEEADNLDFIYEIMELKNDHARND